MCQAINYRRPTAVRGLSHKACEDLSTGGARGLRRESNARATPCSTVAGANPFASCSGRSDGQRAAVGGVVAIAPDGATFHVDDARRAFGKLPTAA